MLQRHSPPWRQEPSREGCTCGCISRPQNVSLSGERIPKQTSAQDPLAGHGDPLSFGGFRKCVARVLPRASPDHSSRGGAWLLSVSQDVQVLLQCKNSVLGERGGRQKRSRLRAQPQQMDLCDHFYFGYAYLSSAENPQPFEWHCSANHTVLRAAGMGAGCAEEALCNPGLARSAGASFPPPRHLRGRSGHPPRRAGQVLEDRLKRTDGLLLLTPGQWAI